MNNFSGRQVFSAIAFLVTASVIQGQTANLISHSVIVAQPPDPIHFEKSIGNFTSTSYPSFFLGTGDSGNGYIYDTQTGNNCTLGIPADYYERSRPFTYTGDSYAGVIASLFTSVAWLENPLNYGGSLCGGWPIQTINPNRGSHELRLADLDGDGKLDVLASGSQFPTDLTVGFIAFQNSLTPGHWGHLRRPRENRLMCFRLAALTGAHGQTSYRAIQVTIVCIGIKIPEGAPHAAPDGPPT